MKIGVMSDTHGSLDTMRQAAKKMMDSGVEAIIHLGDDSTDAEQLNSLPIDLYWVPGIFEERYKNPDIQNRVIKEFEDIPFLISHTGTKDPHDIEGDIDPAEAIADGDIKVMLHGHSHVWRIYEEKGVIIINPGHLKPDDAKGGGPSFAILGVTPRKLEVRIYSLKGDVLAEKTFFFEA